MTSKICKLKNTALLDAQNIEQLGFVKETLERELTELNSQLSVIIGDKEKLEIEVLICCWFFCEC